MSAERVDLDSLTALLEAATPGPWSGEAGGSEGYYIFGPRGLDERYPMRRARIASVTWGTFEDDKANTALIAAAVNALPALLAEVKDAREALAEAWDDGFEAGHRFARYVNPEFPASPTNPYRAALSNPPAEVES